MAGGLAVDADGCENAAGTPNPHAANKTATNVRKNRLCSTRFSPDRANSQPFAPPRMASLFRLPVMPSGVTGQEEYLNFF
jgi:hypothetical protein